MRIRLCLLTLTDSNLQMPIHLSLQMLIGSRSLKLTDSSLQMLIGSNLLKQIHSHSPMQTD